jgi:hypothetical protein
MSLPATDRYGLGPAEGGLALVQELLNTKPAAGHPDLLADPAWAAGHGAGADLPRLRHLRAALAGALAGTPASSVPAGSLGLRLEAGGTVTAAPRGAGAAGLVSAVLAAAYLAQRDGTWARLKLCRKPACAVAFYDRSRNNSGVWHDARTCGNAANLRASRARRRPGPS